MNKKFIQTLSTVSFVSLLGIHSSMAMLAKTEQEELVQNIPISQKSIQKFQKESDGQITQILSATPSMLEKQSSDSELHLSCRGATIVHTESQVEENGESTSDYSLITKLSKVGHTYKDTKSEQANSRNFGGGASFCRVGLSGGHSSSSSSKHESYEGDKYNNNESKEEKKTTKTIHNNVKVSKETTLTASSLDIKNKKLPPVERINKINKINKL